MTGFLGIMGVSPLSSSEPQCPSSSCDVISPSPFDKGFLALLADIFTSKKSNKAAAKKKGEKKKESDSWASGIFASKKGNKAAAKKKGEKKTGQQEEQQSGGQEEGQQGADQCPEGWALYQMD